jgi:hypothetical protein
VAIRGLIDIKPGSGQQKPVAISLRDFRINRLGNDTNFADLQIFVDGNAEKHILSRAAAATLVEKISKVSNLKNSDSRYWTGGKKVSLPLQEKE